MFQAEEAAVQRPRSREQVCQRNGPHVSVGSRVSGREGGEVRGVAEARLHRAVGHTR